ncbi:unnamed protein product [Schistosoma margrebowiei]|uniref:LIM zinc-binding domain-containing protein n=1 Tax=Schistosoma margrebowiei TaxID=48269 RepID=A0AA85AJ39_9TREM|nr:unnamed protein product [Schistosoma margrebowiei]
MMKNRFEPIACPVCSKNVYFAEEVRAMGRAFHKQCFKCCQCSKALDSFTANDHKGSLYCKNCYAKNYGPNVYGFSTNSTLMRSTYDLRDCTKMNGYSHSHSPMINQSQDYHSQDRLTHLEHSGNYIPRPFRLRWSSGNCNSTRCANCSDIVYANERIDAVGKVFHRLCFKCNDCQRLLDRGTACDHNREVFCHNCYIKNFGSKGLKAGTNLRCA